MRSIFDGRVRVAAASVGDWGSFLQLFSISGGANEMRADIGGLASTERYRSYSGDRRVSDSIDESLAENKICKNGF